LGLLWCKQVAEEPAKPSPAPAARVPPAVEEQREIKQRHEVEREAREAHEFDEQERRNERQAQREAKEQAAREPREVEESEGG
jgi:hypothetical protein